MALRPNKVSDWRYRGSEQGQTWLIWLVMVGMVVVITVSTARMVNHINNLHREIERLENENCVGINEVRIRTGMEAREC